MFDLEQKLMKTIIMMMIMMCSKLLCSVSEKIVFNYNICSMFFAFIFNRSKPKHSKHESKTYICIYIYSCKTWIDLMKRFSGHAYIYVKLKLFRNKAEVVICNFLNVNGRNCRFIKE